MSTQVRILHTTIALPFAAAYEFTHRPENFPKWAAGLSTSLHETEHGWVADTPEGEASVTFSERNPHGVLDHWVRFEGRPDIHIPLRMIANGDGTEVELVLFRQPDMTDEMFDRDAGMVTKDLAKLKALLESGGHEGEAAPTENAGGYAPISFARKFDLVAEHWQPKVVAEMNDYQFKIVRIAGDFVWHSHADTDETFIVLDGTLRIDFRDGAVTLRRDEMFVVPKGKEHKPYAASEVKMLLIEPRGVVNTGDEGSGERTAQNDVWI